MHSVSYHIYDMEFTSNNSSFVNNDKKVLYLEEDSTLWRGVKWFNAIEIGRKADSSPIPPSFLLSPAVLVIPHITPACMCRIWSVSHAQVALTDVPARWICMWKNLMTHGSNFWAIFERRGVVSVCVLRSRGFFGFWFTECGSTSPCYSTNQPVIPVLLIWEAMLCATLSFSHQCSLCLHLYLSLPLHILSEGLLLRCDWAIVSNSLTQPACWACLHGFMLLGCWLMQHLCSFNCLLF